MSVTTGTMDLNAALKVLRLRWDEATLVWNDSVRHEFEEQVWLPLTERVVATLRAMDRLAPVLIKMRQDCE